MTGPPVLVLGVRRSGTTLLRVMLDRNPVLAVPDESYFVPTLARRHGDRPDPDAFVDDLRRLSTLREWGIDPREVRERLRADTTLGEAIAAIYEAYAAQSGKERWGDKTPMYMQHLPLLERLFPAARFVHLIRDGRDAAVSFLGMPEGVATRTWAYPDSPAGFACQWRDEVAAARSLGRRVGRRYAEVRYEALVQDPEAQLRRICAFAELPWDAGMLDYAGTVDLSGKPHQRSLARPPTPGLRDWRRELPERHRVEFEAIAGELLAELGYEVTTPPGGARARLRRAAYAVRSGAWRASAAAVQRSPLWRRRHPRVV
jgi:Sulfotransferase family